MPGGAEVLTRLRDLTKIVRDLIDVDRRTIVLHPEDVEERRDHALDRLHEILAILDKDLPPMLERNEKNREAASLPDRVAALERDLAEVQARLEGRGRVVPLDQRRIEGG